MAEQILRFKGVAERVGLGRTYIYELVRDGAFPQPIALGKRARGWRLSEIEAWIKARDRAEKWQPRGKRAA
jgi:prophage regulatory protein